MAETELERLVIRLVGDGSLYQKMLTTAQASTQQTAQFIESATKRIEDLGTGLKGFAGNFVQALGAFGLVTSLGSAFEKFSTFERNTARLNIAIEANGKNVKDTVEEYQKFTKTMTDTTLATKSQIAALIQQGEIRGLSTENTKKATRDSVALAAALGGEASEYMRAAIGLQTHQFHALRHIPALRGIKDESKVVAQYQKFVALGMKQAAAETEMSSGKIEKLKRTFMGLATEIGAIVAQAITPLLSGLEKAAKWFNDLDPVVKKITVAFVTANLALLAFKPALGTLAPLFGVLAGPLKLLTGLGSSLSGFGSWLIPLKAVFGLIGPIVSLVLTLLNPVKLVAGAFSAVVGVLGLVLSPLGVIIALVGVLVAVVAVWVNRTGGIGKAWEVVKQKAVDAWGWVLRKGQEFMDWMTPVWDAFASLASTAWGMIKQGASNLYDWLSGVFDAVKEYVASVWESMTGDALPTWDTIRDAVRDAILFAEFTLRNFKQVASWVWAGVLYDFIRLTNEVEFFFTDTIPAALKWFATNWKDIFLQAVNNASFFIQNLVSNIVRVITNLPGLIRGKVAWGDVWKPLSDGFVDIVPKLKLPARVAGELERQLKDDFERQGAALGKSFQEFRRQKLGEFAEKGVPPEVLENANKAGSDLGKSYANGANKEIKKLDAVVIGSAESFAKITAYQDRLSGLKDAKANTATDAKSAAGLQKQDKANQLLQDIRDGLKDSPKVNIAPGGELA